MTTEHVSVPRELFDMAREQIERQRLAALEYGLIAVAEAHSYALHKIDDILSRATPSDVKDTAEYSFGYQQALQDMAKPSAPRVVTAQMVKRAVRAYDESTGDSWPGCVEQSIRYALVAALSSMDDFPECSGNSNDCPENEGYGCCQSGVVARMQDAMKESRSDTERLDWLALHPSAAKIMVNGESKECIFWGISSSPEHTLREAIDAAAAPQAGERG